MVNNNGIPIEVNKKPFELVQELKDEHKTLSYEEFIKNYESDGNLSYDDLSSGGIGEVKGYGPCSSCSGSNRDLTFELDITLKNCIGNAKGCTAYNTDFAREQAGKIIAETGHWTDDFLSCYSKEDRRKLVDRINDKINYHKEGNSIKASVCNKGGGRSPVTSSNVSLNDLDNYSQIREDCMYGMGGYSGAERSGRGGFLD